MLSKSQISYVNSLHLKKFRKLHGLFIVEGLKSITEFYKANYTMTQIFHVPEMLPKVAIFPQKIKFNSISPLELKKISTLVNPQGILAIFKIPDDNALTFDKLKNRCSLVLDAIQDPGNVGTIIRTADWFGIEHIICSHDTVEVYSPKVVQATMGSLARVAIHYIELEEWLPHSGMKIYGTLLDGASIYDTDFTLDPLQGSLIILGNEGHGIRPQLLPFIHHKITIPRFRNAESLNVAIAAAIICSEMKRKNQ